MRQTRRRLQRERDKETRRLVRHPGDRERFPLWLMWTGIGLLAVVGLVFIVLAASGVFSRKGPSGPVYVLTSLEMARLASPGHAKGDAGAPVTVLEFADFQCPFCKGFWSGPLQKLEEEFVGKGQVKFVFRHLAFLGPESLAAAEAAECAADQGQFFPYHDLLFQNQGPENSGRFTTERLTGFAQQLGLDSEQFSTCLESHKDLDRVNQSNRDATALGIRGTPTVLINGRPVRDPQDLNEMRGIIRDELKRAS